MRKEIKNYLQVCDVINKRPLNPYFRFVGTDSFGRNISTFVGRPRQPDLHGVVCRQPDEGLQHRASPRRRCPTATEKRLHLHPGSGKLGRSISWAICMKKFNFRISYLGFRFQLFQKLLIQKVNLH